MEDLPVLPVIYGQHIIDMMQEQGLDATEILRDSGINPLLLNRQDASLTLRQIRSLIQRFIGITSLPMPALEYGFRLDLVSHGLLGHVFLWRGDFRELIETILAYLRVRLPVVNIDMSQTEHYFSIHLSPRLALNEVESFILQAFVASIRKLAETIVRNFAIYCPKDFFHDIDAAQQLLKVPIHTESAGIEIRFYSSQITLDSIDKQTTAKTNLHADHSFIVRLRGQLLNDMRKDQSAEAIASALGMSVRTLRRRLEEIGSSFNEIRLDVRMHVATRYLTTTSISLQRIAEHVGYGDQASFTRAFKDWAGETPGRIRQRRVLKTSALQIDKSNGSS